MTQNRIVRLLDRLFSDNPSTAKAQDKKAGKKLHHRQTRLSAERLEDRKVMAAGFGPVPADVAASSPIVNESMPEISSQAAEVRVTNASGSLTRSQLPAIGVVTDARNGGTCTGTLISPRHVLTAAHCVRVNRPEAKINLGPRDVRFIVGGQGGAVYSSEHYVVGGRWDTKTIGTDTADDIAIVTLNRPVSGVTPIPIATSAPRVGSWVYLVGFGKTGDGYNGAYNNNANRTKNWGVTRVDSVSQGLIKWRYDRGEANTASGDSGGPQLSCNSQGANCSIVSVTSGGAGDRYGSWSFNTRVDRFASAIRSIISNGGVRAGVYSNYNGPAGSSLINARVRHESANAPITLGTSTPSLVERFGMANKSSTFSVGKDTTDVFVRPSTPAAMSTTQSTLTEVGRHDIDEIFGSDNGVDWRRDAVVDILAAAI